jgi:RHS repeat-associated protein
VNKLSTPNFTASRMLKVLAVVTATFINLSVMGQTRTYVQEDVIKISGVTTSGQVDALSQADKQTTRTYFDGLGRTIQTVAIQVSPLQKDMVQPVVYNTLGQQTTNYLPYVPGSTDGAYHSDAITEQHAFYQITTDKVAVNDDPYSARVFENSPLLRLLKEGMAGTGFQPVSGGHYKEVAYRSNVTADNVLQWSNDGTTSPTYYAATKLSVTIAKDEQQIETRIFTDLYGHVVLKRQVNGSTFLDTYYIYNIAGLVSYVVPPKAIAIMQAGSNYSLSQTGVDRLIFKYQYDKLGRVVEKTIPAASALYMVYDTLSRPVLIQDGNLRTYNQWNYIKYDIQGRAISQGIYTDATHTTRAGMQSYVTGLVGYVTTWAEERNGTSGTGYYTNAVFPTSSIEPLAYSYYDNYDLDSNGSNDCNYVNEGLSGEPTTATARTRGLLTMLRKRTVGPGLGDIWLTSAYFYDSKERLLQTQGNNQLNSTVADISTTVLNFISKPTVSKVTKVTSVTTTVKTDYSYDAMYRLTALDQTYNSNPALRVAAYEYNEIGQLVKKNLNSITTGPIPANITLGTAESVASGQTVDKIASNSITMTPNFTAASGSVFTARISVPYLQSVDYRYNIRGQMLSINNSTLTVGPNNDDANDVFGMEMSYNDVTTGNTASWNGQLTSVRWMTRDGAGAKGPERNYNYNYDQFNRLTSALYQEKAGGTWNGNGAYDEKDISYDQNGNIMGLKRNSLISGVVNPIDNLTYAYNSNNPNQLKHMTDGTGGYYPTYGFKNLTSSTSDYSYDDNGNLIADPYKGLSFTYNVLNRTHAITITTGTGKYIDYTYDATGVLLRKRQYNNSTLQKTTDYIEGFVYENTTLAYFGTPEGRVVNTSGTLNPQYIITDQQGNARVTVVNNGGTAKVIQENSYYAFGLVMTGGITPTDPNKNLYNGGSEWQNDFGDLPDLMQTYYRNYDQALGRWTGVDPDGESLESMTNYNYAGNNPIMFNDPLGNLLTPDADGIYRIAWSSVDNDILQAFSAAGGSNTAAYTSWLRGETNTASATNLNIDINNVFYNLLSDDNYGGYWSSSNPTTVYVFNDSATSYFLGFAIAEQQGLIPSKNAELRFSMGIAHINMGAAAGLAGYVRIDPKSNPLILGVLLSEVTHNEDLNPRSNNGDSWGFLERGEELLKGLSNGVAISEGFNYGMSRVGPTEAEALAGYGKVLGVTGKILGFAGALNDANKILNKGLKNATIADWTKLGISGGQLLLKTNPYTITFGIVYGIADAAGYNPVDILYKLNFKK